MIVLIHTKEIVQALHILRVDNLVVCFQMIISGCADEQASNDGDLYSRCRVSYW